MAYSHCRGLGSKACKRAKNPSCFRTRSGKRKSYCRKGSRKSHHKKAKSHTLKRGNRFSILGSP